MLEQNWETLVSNDILNTCSSFINTLLHNGISYKAARKCVVLC